MAGHDECSVLLQSLIRGLATPWTYFLHLSLSSVILIDSFTGSPVHVLMLSIQAVCGLPRLRAPGIVPCIISFSRQLPFRLQYAPNRLLAVAPPQTPLRELTALPPDHLAVFKGPASKGRREERIGEGRRDSSVAVEKRKKSRRLWSLGRICPGSI